MNMRFFYTLSIVGFFSLMLFSTSFNTWITPTTVIFMIATVFAGLHVRNLANNGKLSKLNVMLYKIFPTGFPLFVLIIRYIAV